MAPQAASPPSKTRRSTVAAPLGRQAQKTQLARERIVNAVIALIKEGGFVNASSSRIAARAGMTWGAAQHHFGSKEDILDAILAMSHQRYTERMADAGLRSGKLERRVDRFVDLMWAHYQDDVYLAGLEILLAMRGFASMPKRWEQRQTRAHLKTMREIFHDSPVADQQLIEALNYAHCALTGFSIERVFETRLRYLSGHLQRLKTSLQAMLVPG